MQDLDSGEMRDLTPFMKDIPKVTPEELGKMMVDANSLRDRIPELNKALQEAKDRVQPDRSKQGPVFVVGEVLDIRGGKFMVTRIEPGHLRLKSIPSYHL